MKTFKIALFVLAGFTLMLPSCKSKKMTAVERVPQQVIEEPVGQPEQAALADVPTRTERFTFEQPEQAVTHNFFVIVGSYSMSDNADRARTILTRQGFTPIVLKSETGLNRMSVNSYTNEAEARMRVQDIRRNFPEYHDAWLLIRQQ